MNKPQKHSLQERVARLEAQVAELQRALRDAQSATTPSSPSSSAAPPATPRPAARPIPQRPAKQPFALPAAMRSGEFWLNKIGIALLLFGVAFLFKYAIDQGWLTPPVRIAFGLLLGGVLLAAGVRVAGKQKHFSQVLLGGAIATFYITGFAAFQLFELVSHPVAFAFMVAVTLLAFWLALLQNGVALALIGTIGGLGTPFLLYTGSGNLPGLIGYTCLLLAGAGAIFFRRGWRSLLWTTVAGGWAIMLLGLDSGLPAATVPARSDQWALQGGIIFGWLLFWLLPLLRDLVVVGPTTPSAVADSMAPRRAGTGPASLHRHVHLLVLLTPLIALGLSMPVWEVAQRVWGWITLAGAGLYGLIAWRLRAMPAGARYGYTHAVVSVLLVTIALFLLLKGNTLIFALAAEAAALHLLARRTNDGKVAAGAHVLFGLVGWWLLLRLFAAGATGTPIANARALSDLAIIVIATALALRVLAKEGRLTYLLAGHIAFLGWLLRELGSLSNGQGYVTIAWGIYAVLLLVLGLQGRRAGMRRLAMATLVLVVGKLFLVDLAELETLWRVLLFLGFGGLFLLLSYFLRDLWSDDREPPSS